MHHKPALAQRQTQQDLVATAAAAGSFNVLLEAVAAAGLVEILQGDGPFTIFAPNDEAFARLPRETLDAVLTDPDRLSRLLANHLVPRKLSSSDLARMASVDTVHGRRLDLTTTPGVRVNQVHVLMADLESSNGVIHEIGSVLFPEERP